jgi:sterol 14-demethylase
MCILSLIFRKNMKTHHSPPMLRGRLPLLGHVLSFQKDRASLLRKGYEQHGPIFSIQLFNKKAVVLASPTLHRAFFMQTDKSLSISKPYTFLKPVVGEVMFVAGPEQYNRERPVFYEPFKRDKMKRYLPIMQAEIQKWLDNLDDAGKFEVGKAMRHLTQQIAAATFMGLEFQHSVGQEFWDQYEYLSLALDPILPPKLPLPKFRRRDRARQKMGEILKPVIQKRLEQPEAYDDLLQDLINKAYALDLGSEEYILNLIIGLMFAGHETTAGQAAWTVIQLLQHPDYRQKVQTEVDRNLPWDREFVAQDLQALPHTQWAVDESGRMHPSADVLFRTVEEDLELEGYHIPAGQLLIVSPGLSQMLGDIFPEPERYDPERHDPANYPKGKLPSYQLIGFGGGRHLCAGKSFAIQEMMLIAAMLLQQLEMELLPPEPKAVATGGSNWLSPAWVRYRKREQPKTQAEASEKQAECPHHQA